MTRCSDVPSFILGCAIALAVCTAIVEPAHSQALPRRDIGGVVATAPSRVTWAPSPVGSVRVQLVELSDGRVLLADGGRRRVVLLDSALREVTVVIDSVPGRDNTFSSGSVLLPFLGDSALFYDRSAGAMVVVTPGGTLGRVIAPPMISSRASPGPDGAPSIPAFSPTLPTPTTSRTLGLVFRLRAPPVLSPPEVQEAVRRRADSMFVVSMDFTSRTIDTLAKIATGTETVQTGTRVQGQPAVYPFHDEVVVTSDGSVAIFHARECRIAWITPNGRVGAGLRLSCPWQPISDSQRVVLVDSINSARRQEFENVLARRAADSARTGRPPMTVVSSLGPDGTRVDREVVAPPPTPPMPVSAVDVPDFFPVSGSHAVLTDSDNRIWIRWLQSDREGTRAWDIFDRQGNVVDRVRVPQNLVIVGFGKGGTIFTLEREGEDAILQKRRMR